MGLDNESGWMCKRFVCLNWKKLKDFEHCGQYCAVSPRGSKRIRRCYSGGGEMAGTQRHSGR